MPEDTPRHPPDLPGMEPSARDGEFDTGFAISAQRRPELDVYGVAPEEDEEEAVNGEPERPAPDREEPAGEPAPRSDEALAERGDQDAAEGEPMPPSRRPLFARPGEPKHVPAPTPVPEEEDSAPPAAERAPAAAEPSPVPEEEDSAPPAAERAPAAAEPSPVPEEEDSAPPAAERAPAAAEPSPVPEEEDSAPPAAERAPAAAEPSPAEPEEDFAPPPAAASAPIESAPAEPAGVSEGGPQREPARRLPPPPAPAPSVPEDEREEGGFRRADVYPDRVERGRAVADTSWRRALTQVVDLCIPPWVKAERELDEQVRAMRRVTRTNLIVSLSPKGGVGKTTCTFIVGNLLASHCKLRTLIVDANPQYGTLATLAPDDARTDLSLSDLLANLDDVESGPELQPYVAPLPTGCHLLGAPTDPAVMARMGPDEYTRLLKFLRRYYEVILLDLGTGVVDPLSQTAIRAADQGLLVTTHDYVTTEKVIGVVGYLGASRDANLGEDAAAPPEQVLTVVLNKAPREGSGDRQQIEAAFRRQRVGKSVIVPADDRLRVMLDSATYTLDDLPRKTRVAIKHLGLAVARDLV